MSYRFKPRKTGVFRVKWLITFMIVGAVATGGGYFFYKYQKKQNTLRLLQQARQAQENGDWEQAITSYRLYLQRRPVDTESLQCYADILLEKVEVSGQAIGEAVRTLKRLSRLQPEKVETIDKLTNIYLAIREYSFAADHAQKWLELDPDSIDAILTLARAWHGLHENEKSLTLLLSAVEKYADHPRLYPPLIELILINDGESDQAMKVLEKGLQANPDAYELHMAAVALFEYFHDDTQAEQHLKIALQLNPDHPYVVIPAAAFYVARDRLEEAQPLLNRARTLAPENQRYLTVLAAWAIKKQDPDLQRSIAQELSQRGDDQDAILLARSAELFLRAGDYHDAAQCIKKLEAIENHDSQLQTWVDTLKGAQAVFLAKPFTAIPHLTKALRRNPTDLWTLELLAMAYENTGAIHDAAEYYGRILMQKPRTASVRLALAKLSWKQGLVHEALSHIDALTSPTIRLSENQTHLRELIKLTCELELLVDQPGSVESKRKKELQNSLQQLALKIQPTMVAAELLTKSFVWLQDVQQVLQWFKQQSLDENSGPLIGNVIAGALIEEGAMAQADQLADQLIQQYPDAYQGYNIRVRILAGRNEHARAKQWIMESTIHATQKAQLWLSLANAFTRTSNLTQAVEAVRKAIELQPHSIAMRVKLARLTTDVSEAKTCTDHIRAIEGDDGLQWRYERASYLMRLNPRREGATEAITLLQPCLVDRSGWIAARVLLGIAYEITEQLDKAAEAYRSAIAQQPELAKDEVAVRLVNILHRTGKTNDADSVLDSLIVAASDSLGVLRLQTQRYLRNNNLTAAIETAEQCIALGMNDPQWIALTAELHLRAQHFTRAEEMSRNALIQYPKDTTIRWVLARTLVAHDKIQQAEDMIRHGVQKFDDAMHHLLLHQFFVYVKRFDDARLALEQALQLDPDDPTVNGAASDYWGRLKDRDKQLAYAEKAVELRGENPKESLTMARLLVAGGNLQQRTQAKAIVQNRLTLYPNDVNALLLQAELALTDKPQDITAAQASLNHALKMDPRFVKAYQLLASIQMGTGRFDQARDLIDAGLTVALKDPDLLMRSAELYAHSGEYPMVIATLHQILQIKPRHPLALRLLVNAYRNTRRADRAIVYFEKMAPVDQMNQTELELLATLYEQVNQFGRAKEMFLRAIQKNENSASVFQNYLHFLARQQSYMTIKELATQRIIAIPDDISSYAVAAEILASDGASEIQTRTGHAWLSNILKNNPEHAADAAFRSGICYYKHNDIDQAQNMFTRALQLAPLAPRVVNALSWLYARDRNEPQLALKQIEQFIISGGRPNAELLDTHAAILLQLDRLDEAREKILSCLEVAGQSAPFTAANFRMGLLLLESGDKSDKDEAISYIRHALELNDRLGGLTEKEHQQALALLSP